MFNGYNGCGYMPKKCCQKPEMKKIICFEEKNYEKTCNKCMENNYFGYSNNNYMEN